MIPLADLDRRTSKWSYNWWWYSVNLFPEPLHDKHYNELVVHAFVAPTMPFSCDTSCWLNRLCGKDLAFGPADWRLPSRAGEPLRTGYVQFITSVRALPPYPCSLQTPIIYVPCFDLIKKTLNENFTVKTQKTVLFDKIRMLFVGWHYLHVLSLFSWDTS